tara:strand:+ start:107 stop:259 length:153 start_codon:yes stop_codon:yes gene_type:complete
MSSSDQSNPNSKPVKFTVVVDPQNPGKKICIPADSILKIYMPPPRPEPPT